MKTLLRWLLGPLKNPLADRAKTLAVTATSTIVSALASHKVLQAAGIEIPAEQINAIALTVGGVVAGLVADSIESYKRGGTAALQKLLTEKYGIPLLVDDWFGPQTQEAAAEVIALSNGKK